MVPKMLLLVLFVGSASAATWRGKLPEKPVEFADKVGCYVREINDVIPFGKTITPIGYCYRITCGESLISYASCGVISTSAPCYVTKTDLSKPHPICCPTVKFDDENEIFDTKTLAS